MDTKDERRADRKHTADIRAGKLDLDDLEEKAADDYALDGKFGNCDDWLWAVSVDSLRNLILCLHMILRKPLLFAHDIVRHDAQRTAAIEALAEIEDVIDKCAADFARRLREDGDL